MLLYKIKKDIEELGFNSFLVHQINRGLRYISTKILIEYFYIFKIPVNNRRTKIPDFLRNTYQVDILHRYSPDLKAFPTTRETIDYRFKQNAVCLLALKNKIPIGFLWLVQKNYQEDIVFCDIHLGLKLAWDFDVYILDKFRFTPAFTILWDNAFNYLEKRSVQYVYSRISTINKVSINVHERLGGNIVGKIMFIKCGKIHVCLDMIQCKISIHSQLNRKTIELESIDK